jgi:NAD(P)H-hydrate repair Nnr-like enzyme with NAD(P)H-hydrate dehydratase domain
MPIKSYSPENIVHSLLQEEDCNKMLEWFPAINSLVIGPGLGRAYQIP